jgi:hypothetical protein
VTNLIILFSGIGICLFCFIFVYRHTNATAPRRP